MSDVSTSVAPFARLPWDVDEVANAALDILRLDADDEDAARILVDAETATELVDAELDYAVAPTTVPRAVIDAAVNLTIELYRRKDAPFGITDSWTVDGASIRLSNDVMRTTRSMLTKHKKRFGIG
jgi:hypothetical protein